LREALVSSGRLKKVFARFTAEGAHVPLIAGTVMEGIHSGALRDDVNPLFLLVATMALGFMPVVARRLAQGALPDLQLPPPGEMASGLTQALLHGIGARAAIRWAINHPEGCDPLHAQLRPGMKVVIALDDISLPLPPMRTPDVRQTILEIVLNLLADSGVDDVHLLIANALHRRLTPRE